MAGREQIIIDGAKTATLIDFYDEIQKLFCPNFKAFGRNMDALVDVLRGGFGVDLTNVEIIWIITRRGRESFPKFDKFVEIFNDSGIPFGVESTH